MLEHPEPVPTGLITALLARSQVRGVAVSERIGPSPRQMRELTEGRGLFSPFKLNRVSELTGVPEERIRAAQGLITEIGRAVRLRTGERRTHPRLGEVTILSTGPEISVRLRDGRVLEGVQAVSFAGPEVLDLFGLTPGGVAPPEEPQAALPADAHPHEADSEPDMIRMNTENEILQKDHETMTCETKLMSSDPEPEPAVLPDPERGTIGSPSDPTRTLPRVSRGLVERLVAGSGLSRNALSRALGRDPAFLSGVLTRGRRMPPELLEPLARACGADPVEILAEAGLDMNQPGVETQTQALKAPESVPDEAPVAALTRVAAGEEAVVETETTGAEEGSDLIEGIGGAAATPPGQKRTRAVLEVIIDGVLRIRIPSGFDMEAAARLIRSLTGVQGAVAGADR
jgi:hypothetical protein